MKNFVREMYDYNYLEKMVDDDEDDLGDEHYEIIDIQDEEDNSNNDAEVIEEEHGVEGINDEVSDNQSEADDFYGDTINNSDSGCSEDSYDDDEEFRGDNVVCRVPKSAQME